MRYQNPKGRKKRIVVCLGRVCQIFTLCTDTSSEGVGVSGMAQKQKVWRKPGIYINEAQINNMLSN